MADGSISVKYSERLLLFVELFSWLLTEDFLDEYHHIAELRLSGNYASTNEIIGALVRFAMAQENLTDGGAYLMQRDADRGGLLGLLQGFPAHTFILAHELSHKLLDEVDTAPELARWIGENSLTVANREIAADALALELVKIIYEPYEQFEWVGSAGAAWALTTLQAIETGSHARLSNVSPSFDERLDALAGKFQSSKSSTPDRRRFLTALCLYERFVPDRAWDALRFLVRSRRVAVKGRALEAIDLAQFGDVFLVMGKVDVNLNFLRSRTSPGYSLADCAGAILFSQGDDISAYTSRYVETLDIQGYGREALEDPRQAVRYYDLIDWIWKSPRISELANIDRDIGYGSAIYLAGAYAGACQRAQEEQR
ncbi:hypothetical protein [Streptomyces sp. NPDC051636]|uniref:hypothetical protein n=1 Tax=Streptomyces sp. NPDC051636 TaxID=3365663 RepID=UPI0037B7836F